MVTVDENIKNTEQKIGNVLKSPDNADKKGADKPFEFSDLKNNSESGNIDKMDVILDIPVEITVELGRTRMLINELLKLGQGSVVELSKPAGETLEILANNKLIARGEVVVMNENYSIRINEIASPVERIERLG